eukprot:2490848-Amphidinium_carterae.2
MSQKHIWLTSLSGENGKPSKEKTNKGQRKRQVHRQIYRKGQNTVLNLISPRWPTTQMQHFKCGSVHHLWMKCPKEKARRKEILIQRVRTNPPLLVLTWTSWAVWSAMKGSIQETKWMQQNVTCGGHGSWRQVAQMTHTSFSASPHPMFLLGDMNVVYGKNAVISTSGSSRPTPYSTDGQWTMVETHVCGLEPAHCIVLPSPSRHEHSPKISSPNYRLRVLQCRHPDVGRSSPAPREE